MEGSAQGSATAPATISQLPRLDCSSVLHLGDDERSVTNALAADSPHVAYVETCDALTLQLGRRFDVVVVGGQVLLDADDGHRRAVMHTAMQHIDRGGHLIVLHESARPVLGDGFWAIDLHLLGSYPLASTMLSLYRRGDRTTVHDLVFEARSTIQRLSPAQLAQRLHAVDGTVVLDTRTHTDRERFGVIPDAVHVPRTVVEWHFDPANGYLHPAMRSFDQPLVLVCNGGYSSSLAAANLVRLGFTDVADLIGGHAAWAAAGLPVARADHSHLDTPSFDEQGFSEEP